MSSARDVDFNNEQDVMAYIRRIFIEYEFSCLKEKDAGGCHLLGEYYEGVAKDHHKALEIFENNCDERAFPASCFKYGKQMLNGLKAVEKYPTDIKPDIPRAYAAFAKGCQGDFGPACCYQALVDKQGYKDEHPPNAPQAVASMRKCCMQNDARCCHYLSSWFLGQRGQRKRLSQQEYNQTPGSVPENMTLAFEYAVKACELGEAEACVNVSRMYATGDGVPKDAQQSDKYKTLAKDIVENVEQNLSISAQG